MIDEKKLAELRKAYANRTETWPYVGNLFECMDTIEALWKVARAAELLNEREPKIAAICGIAQALAALRESEKTK